jgi:ubiquinone/menaquinone biosynthesis C-methylase UbiE
LIIFLIHIKYQHIPMPRKRYWWIPQWTRRAIWKTLHRFLIAKDRNLRLSVLNHGYADTDPAVDPIGLADAEEPNRYGLQLYHRVASALDLAGKEILEVSCGRGGGASYIARCLRPKTYVGLDQSVQTTELCRRVYAVPGLSFVTGDAERLPFAAACFDAVINIEASGNYGDLSSFLKEVVRVLRPKGYLLLADFRETENLQPFKQQCLEAGLRLLAEQNITPNVLRAMDLDHERRVSLVMKLVPRFAANAFRHFAGAKGTGVYRAFAESSMLYYRFVFQKA